jgi:hypothetical protein
MHLSSALVCICACVCGLSLQAVRAAEQVINEVFTVKADICSDIGSSLGASCSELEPVHYAVSDPVGNIRQAFDSYNNNIKEDDKPAALFEAFKLTAMLTDVPELIQDITNDKRYYTKFYNDDVVRAVSALIKNNDDEASELGKTYNSVFDAFLSAELNENLFVWDEVPALEFPSHFI